MDNIINVILMNGSLFFSDSILMELRAFVPSAVWIDFEGKTEPMKDKIYLYVKTKSMNSPQVIYSEVLRESSSVDVEDGIATHFFEECSVGIQIKSMLSDPIEYVKFQCDTSCSSNKLYFPIAELSIDKTNCVVTTTNSITEYTFTEASNVHDTGEGNVYLNTPPITETTDPSITLSDLSPNTSYKIVVGNNYGYNIYEFKTGNNGNAVYFKTDKGYKSGILWTKKGNLYVIAEDCKINTGGIFK